MVKKNPPAVQETWARFLGRGDPLEEGMATSPVFLPGESHGQRSLAGYSPWGRKESGMTEATQQACTRLVNVICGGDPGGTLNFWMRECPSSSSRVITSSPKFLTLFFPPHDVSLTSLGRLSRLLALADALRKKLEYHTRWACNSSRGLFLLDVPLPSRLLHRKPNPFIFIIKVASAPKPHSCLRNHPPDPQAARLHSWKLSLTYPSSSSTSIMICFQMSLKFALFSPFLFRC